MCFLIQSIRKIQNILTINPSLDINQLTFLGGFGITGFHKVTKWGNSSIWDVDGSTSCWRLCVSCFLWLLISHVVQVISIFYLMIPEASTIFIWGWNNQLVVDMITLCATNCQRHISQFGHDFEEGPSIEIHVHVSSQIPSFCIQISMVHHNFGLHQLDLKFIQFPSTLIYLEELMEFNLMTLPVN